MNPVNERATKTLKRRVYFVGFFSLLWIAGITYRLVDLQVMKTGELLSRAQRQNQRIAEVDAKRGTIFDRNGHELAISRDLESCYGVPTEVADPKGTAKKLSAVFGEPEMRTELMEKLTSGKRFIWIKRKLPAEQVDGIKALNLKGIGFIPESKRFNPKAELASHLLGYVGLDNKGLAGLEYMYDREMRGTPGRVLIEIDARNREFSTTTLTPTRPGQNLVLTIDEVIQYMVENELRDAVARSKARGGTIIIVNPRSGEILAMVNWPTYDPNHFADTPASFRRNRAIEDSYEPGSTFKIIIAAASLQEKTARMSEKFDCQYGSIEVAGHQIHDHKPFGTLSMDQIIEYSSNVGSIKLGLRLGNERLYKYMRAFGLGVSTGIDLPGENPGILRAPKQWSLISIGALCMGQEVSVTPLQVLQLASTIANGGVLVHPHIVRQIVSPDGEGWTTPKVRPPERVVSSDVAGDVRDILTDVVEQGTGIAARMDGFSTAGKTGTAQKIDRHTGRYALGHYVSSFVGFTPVDNPAIAMIVVIDEPEGPYYGGLVAAPIYKICAEKILRYLNVFPERRRTVTPQVVYASLNRGTQIDMAVEGGNLIDMVADSTAPAGVATDPSVTVEPAATRGGPSSDDMPAFPDLRGKTIREVARAMRGMGMSFETKGTGYVVAQNPPAGASLGGVTHCQFILSLDRR